MNLNKEQTKRYKEMAKQHAEFLCEGIFKPAFQMAFLHGAKHMYEEIMQGPGYTTEVQFNMPPNWTCPKCKKTYDDDRLACPECQSLNPNAFVDDDKEDDDADDDVEETVEEIRYHGHIGLPLLKRKEMGFETRLKREALEKKQYMVVTAMDHRSCPKCASMAGKILSGTDVEKGMGPPYHSKPTARQKAAGEKGEGCRCILEEVGPDAMEAEAVKQKILSNSPIDWANSQIGNTARNILHSFGVRTYKDLCRWNKKDLLNLRGIGKISVEQIEDYLAKFDLKLG